MYHPTGGSGAEPRIFLSDVCCSFNIPQPDNSGGIGNIRREESGRIPNSRDLVICMKENRISSKKRIQEWGPVEE